MQNDTIDLSCLCDTRKSWCLNQHIEHPLSNLWNSDDTYLSSDCDEQLLLHIEFQERIKLRSLCFTAPSDIDTNKFPSNIKLFVDTPNMGFDSVEDTIPTQIITLNESHFTSETHVLLQFVKFQNLGSITFFIEDNLGDVEQTIISNIKFFGYPLDTCNVAEIKKC